MNFISKIMEQMGLQKSMKLVHFDAFLHKTKEFGRKKCLFASRR